MKLADLNPRGVLDADIVIGGRSVHDTDRHGMGISFECPHCVSAAEEPSSNFSSTEIAIIQGMGRFRVDENGLGWVRRIPTRLAVFFANPTDGKPPSDDHLLWNRTGDSYETMTLSPSIDASASGHWHGFITSGEIR